MLRPSIPDHDGRGAPGSSARAPRRAWSVIFGALLLLGCGRSGPTAATPIRPAPASPSDEPRERVGVVVTPEEAIPVADLLARAEARVDAGAFSQAARDFELLLRGPYVPELQARIHFGYARALEGEGLLPLAVDQLEIRITVVGEDERDAARMDWIFGLLLLERFREAGAAVDRVDVAHLGRDGRVLSVATKVLALSAGGSTSGADALLSRGFLELEEQGEVLGPELARAAAWLSFAQGEVEALRARQVRFDPVPDDVHTVLETRCRHMVAAQSAYAESMRLLTGRLRLLSGLRIAELYLELHHDIVTAPLGVNFSTETSQSAIARGALLLRYEVLLEKAEQMLRITLGGTQDTLAARSVRERLDTALLEVVERRQAARAAVDDLPVLRSDLTQILESLGAPPTAPQLGVARPSEP